MSYRATEFNKINQQFQTEASTFLENNKPSIEQLANVLDCYNAVVVYSELGFKNKKRETKEHIRETIEVNRITIRRAYDKLNIPLTLPGDLLSTIHLLPSSKKTDSSAESATQTENSKNQDNSSQTSDKMTQTLSDFFKMASSVMKDKFEGDPLKLESFITDAEFIESMTEDANKPTFLKFIKTKIAGRARECLPDEADIKSFEDIKTALKKEIKPDSSLVIEGKMATLRLVKGNFTKFAEDAEKLAEAYRRSLIFEKFTREKASELTIRKTKEICRRIAHSDVTKGVIESTVYNNPAEVIATLITQSDIARKEKKEQEPFKKPQNNKNQSQGQNNQKYQKNQQNSKTEHQKGGKKYNKGQNNNNQSGKRTDKDHVIRIVTDATPSTSSENGNAQNTEQVFRYAPS